MNVVKGVQKRKSGAMPITTQAPTPSVGVWPFEKQDSRRNNSKELQSISISFQERPDWNGFSSQTRCQEILFDQMKTAA